MQATKDIKIIDTGLVTFQTEILTVSLRICIFRTTNTDADDGEKNACVGWEICHVFTPTSRTWTELVMVLRANSVAQSLMVDWLSNTPCVSTSRTATCKTHTQTHTPRPSQCCQYNQIILRYLCRAGEPTLLPSGFSTTNTSLQARMPVVSLSQPPRQVKPVRGSSSPPIHESVDWTEEAGEEVNVSKRRQTLLCDNRPTSLNEWMSLLSIVQVGQNYRGRVLKGAEHTQK